MKWERKKYILALMCGLMISGNWTVPAFADDVGAENAHVGEEAASDDTSEVMLDMDDLYIYMLDSRWENYQYDPRDGNARIGDYGCLLCCMTMIQSYVDGAEYRPDELCSRMSFDGNGCIAWCGEIDGQYEVGEYSFSALREKLENDIPVIVRSKTGRKSHFVVVTGYENSGEDASDFKIFDPGNKSRRTLAAHLKKYPKSPSIYYIP